MAGFYYDVDSNICMACSVYLGCSICSDGRTCDACKSNYLYYPADKTCRLCSTIYTEP